MVFAGHSATGDVDCHSAAGGVDCHSIADTEDDASSDYDSTD